MSKVVVRFVQVDCWSSLFNISFFLHWWNCWPPLFRDGCSFCWYWLNCWQLLFRGNCSFCSYWWWTWSFKLSYHNTTML